MFPGGMEWLIILLVIVLLFGASRIPKVMRGMGEGLRAFKDGLEGKSDNDKKDEIYKELKQHIGKRVRLNGSVLEIGTMEGKILDDVSDTRLRLKDEDSVEVVDIAAINKIIEIRERNV